MDSNLRFPVGGDTAHDRLRQAGAIGSRPHSAINLGCDDDLVSTGEILDRTPENLLAAAERMAVRRVEEIDADFERTLDERTALLLAEAPGVPRLRQRHPRLGSALVVLVVAAPPDARLVAPFGGRGEPLVHAPEAVQSAHRWNRCGRRPTRL